MKTSHIFALLVIIIALTILVTRSNASVTQPKGIDARSSNLIGQSATSPLVDEISSFSNKILHTHFSNDFASQGSGALVIDAGPSGNADGKMNAHQLSTNDAVSISPAPAPATVIPVPAVISTLQNTVAQPPNIVLTTPGNNASQNGPAPLPIIPIVPAPVAVAPVIPVTPVVPVTPQIVVNVPAPAPVVQNAIPPSVKSVVWSSGTAIESQKYSLKPETRSMTSLVALTKQLLSMGYEVAGYDPTYALNNPNAKWNGEIIAFDLNNPVWSKSTDANYLYGTYTTIPYAALIGWPESNFYNNLPITDGYGNVVVAMKRASDGRRVWSLIPIPPTDSKVSYIQGGLPQQVA